MVIHKLIDPEQSCFLSGRAIHDNIIEFQEMVHSMENDVYDLPRMLLKVDIEKACATLEWKVILATLLLMGFSDIWVSWIKACASSPSFAFLINCQSSSCIHSSRGICYGDPISPFLFILVTMNLTSILNYSMRMNLVPGFYSRLPKNFNHLMYVDDLIIVMKASRRPARNCLFYLNFYNSLTGQRPNMAKSTVIFPSWFNRKVSKSIKSILEMQEASFPLKYLGDLLSVS